MSTSPFVDGWQVRGDRDRSFASVSLPHDAMIGEPRSADAPSWAHGAYFPGGRYRYRKTWTPGADLAGKEVSLRFEGVYRHCRVLLDGRDVGGVLGGYREFEVRLDPQLEPGAAHVIEVDVDASAAPSARWYTGAGIYRPVWLEVRESIHVVPGGVSLVTRRSATGAHVSVDVELANREGADVTVTVELEQDGALVRSATSTRSTRASVELHLDDAVLWSDEDPALAALTVTLEVDGRETDRAASRVGLREVALDPRRGLVVNGRVVTLRGANVHHDHGVVGAATHAASERRRMRILKEAGFNAIRSAHNPASRAMLAACDELGLYVMDEAYDGWYDHKTEADDAEHFDAGWHGELAAMVAKDRLHPSVILYSIGNENGEAFSPRGRRVAEAMAAELRRLDPSRFSTIGVNLVAAAFAGLGRGDRDDEGRSAKAAPDMTSTAVNAISNRFGLLVTRLPRLAAADRSTRALFDHVDVAGYNYGSSRYRIDAALHPQRIMVGTETMPGDLATNRALVEEIPSLIGDFVWAGWDYLGEAGAGSWSYGTRRAPFMKPYPQLTSGMGIVDITGVPGAALQLARAAWGMLDAPAIAVRPLDVPTGPVVRSSWRATDAVESWSWSGYEGMRAELEIVSADDAVEVVVNGRSLGRRPAGREHGFVARFRTRYEPGVVEAIGYRGGRAVSRSSLRTAGPSRLRLVVEDDLVVGDTTHVRVELADDAGIVDASATDVVAIAIDGPAELVGYGNGAHATEESFADAVHSTHRGRALAVLRATGAVDDVTILAASRRHGDATCTLTHARSTTEAEPSR